MEHSRSDSTPPSSKKFNPIKKSGYEWVYQRGGLGDGNYSFIPVGLTVYTDSTGEVYTRTIRVHEGYPVFQPLKTSNA